MFSKWLDTKGAPKPKPKPKPQNKNPFDNFWKFKVKPNDKTPVCKWKDPANQQKPGFNPNRFNTGIPTGVRNNLLVVDLDVKDDGLEEFKNTFKPTASPTHYMSSPPPAASIITLIMPTRTPKQIK